MFGWKFFPVEQLFCGNFLVHRFSVENFFFVDNCFVGKHFGRNVFVSIDCFIENFFSCILFCYIIFLENFGWKYIFWWISSVEMFLLKCIFGGKCFSSKISFLVEKCSGWIFCKFWKLVCSKKFCSIILYGKNILTSFFIVEILFSSKIFWSKIHVGRKMF